MPTPKTLRYKELIPNATPVLVYDALVNAKTHAKFTGAAATGLGRAGCKFTAWGGYIEGKHIELSRGERIVQEWSTTEWPDGAPPSRLTWTLKQRKGGTEVVMVQTGVPASQAAQYRQGWVDHYFEPLKRYFDRS